MQLRRTLHQIGLCTYHCQRMQALQPAGRADLCRWIVQQRRLVKHDLFCEEAQFTRDGTTNGDTTQQSASFHSKHLPTSLFGERVVRSYRRPTKLSFNSRLPPAFPTRRATSSFGTRSSPGQTTRGCVPSHFGPQVTQYLNRCYGNRWIGPGGLHAWPPRSPNSDPFIYTCGAIWCIRRNRRHEMTSRNNIESNISCFKKSLLVQSQYRRLLRIVSRLSTYVKHELVSITV
jgi:hypothetical protein